MRGETSMFIIGQSDFSITGTFVHGSKGCGRYVETGRSRRTTLHGVENMDIDVEDSEERGGKSARNLGK